MKNNIEVNTYILYTHKIFVSNKLLLFMNYFVVKN